MLYGEGAVANAAILMRDGRAYRDDAGIFVAANYPPLYLDLAGLGDPFVTGRLLSIAAALFVGAAVLVLARPAGTLAALALGAGWLALAPVALRAPALKPDALPVACAVGAVLLLRRGGPRAALAAGALLALAAWMKPTALLPAAALLGWLALTDRRRAALALGGAAGASVPLLARAAALGPADVWRHVVTWNALPWDPAQAATVGLLALAALAVPLGAWALLRGPGGAVAAYGIGALGVAALSGREGATINYLLDLCAAAVLALAILAPRLRVSARFPLAATAQLALALAVFVPFGVVPGREPTVGAWSDPARVEVARALPSGAAYLAEDAGLLVAAGHEPHVDDLFLWSRLVRRDLLDPAPLLARVRAGGFAAILSEVRLDGLEDAPAYERQRWIPPLAAAVLERYVLDRYVSDGDSTRGVWVYRPR